MEDKRFYYISMFRTLGWLSEYNTRDVTMQFITEQWSWVHWLSDVLDKER